MWFWREIRLLTRLCENSEMAFWKNEKRVLGPLAAKENAPYRNCGGRFSRVAGWRGVFAQSVTLAATRRRLLGSRLSKFQADFIGGVLQQSAIDNGKILLGDRIVAPLQVQ